MKKIVSIIKPFTYTQNVFVYENGEQIKVISTDLNNLSNKLIDLADEYETTDAELIGNVKFLQGVKKDIETAEMTRYNKNMLNIKISGK